MKRASWRFLRSGSAPGAANMERDEALARLLFSDRETAFLRVYTWDPWAISLGRYQKDSQIDEALCRADGIDLVRRPTGGRAILHAEELTYCVALRVPREEAHRVYSMIGFALQTGLRCYGVEAALERSQPPFGRLYRSPSSIPCFSSSARSEVVWQGKKLVGSAQRRYTVDEDVVVLQHGSILCGPAHTRLVRYLRLDEDTKRMISESLEGRTADLQQILGRPVDPDDLGECIRKGFEESFGVEEGMDVTFTVPDEANASEKERAG